MALQRISSLGVVSSVSLGTLLGCTGVLGIEEATCDVTYDTRCASAIESLEPAAGSGGSSMVTGGSGGAAAGSGGAAGSATMGGAAGSGGAPPTDGRSLCDRYCETIATACTGQNEQYASPAACQAVCSRLEPGAPGNFAGNTIECRLARAELASATGEPQNYCFSAGPGGAGVCGDDCEGFCAVMAETCSQMGSFEQCLPDCLDVPNLAGPPDNLTYDTSQQAGDSVQCRLFHVSAATLDPITHCVHAAGIVVCAPPMPLP
jgi:hypothetical protein